MTNEEKQLLLRDLCARLPYKVKVQYLDLEDNRLDSDIAMGVTLDGYKGMPTVDVFQYGFLIEKVKPYLRPMSSMTEEEKNELRGLLWFGYPSDDYDNYSHRGIEIKNCLYDNEDKPEYDFEDFELLEEFLFKNHFDYRGLIEKGLAIEVTEENNPYKE